MGLTIDKKTVQLRNIKINRQTDQRGVSGNLKKSLSDLGATDCCILQKCGFNHINASFLSSCIKRVGPINLNQVCKSDLMQHDTSRLAASC